jgi:hypothetical protein
MKKQDFLIIFAVVVMAGMLTYFVAGKFISSPKNRQAKVQQVAKVQSSLKRPIDDDTLKQVFVKDALNITQDISIGDGSGNGTPFNKPNVTPSPTPKPATSTSPTPTPTPSRR